MPYTSLRRAYPNRPVPPKAKPYWHRFVHPIWITEHLDWDGFKVIFRDWLATFAMVVVEIVPYSREWFGSTIYLLPIMTYVSPSGQLSVPTAIITNIVMMLYIIFSWICGNILPMAISNRYFYGRLKKEDFANMLIEEGVCRAGPLLESCLMNACEHGHFMKGNASVVYAFWFAVVCSVNFFLKFRDPVFYGNGAITGMIATAVCAQTSMHTPWVDIKFVGALMTKPMGVAFATNVFVAFAVFPFTAGFQYTTFVTKAFRGTAAVLRHQRDFLAKVRPSDPDAWLSFSKHEALVTQTRMLVPVLKITSGSLPLEVSFTRFQLASYPSFFITFARLTSTLAGITTIYDSLENARQAVIHLESENIDARSLALSIDHPKSRPVGVFESRHSMSAVIQSTEPLSLEVLDETLAELDAICGPVLEAMQDMISFACEWIDAANHFRFYAIFPWVARKHAQRQQHMAQQLVDKRTTFADALAAFKRAHSEHDEKMTPFIALQKALYVEYVNELVRAVSTLLDALEDLDRTRPAPRLTTGLSWRHLQLHRLAKMATTVGQAEALNENDAERNLDNEMRKKPRDSPDYPADARRDPDHLPSQHLLHRIGYRVRKVYHFVIQNKYMVPVKSALFTLIPLLPCLIKQSHWWFYSHRVYWAVVMTNMSIAEYSADNLFNAVNRVVHTFYACVIGMVAWYISTGNGRGNYYGYGVVMGFIAFFSIAYREFIPPGRSYFPRIMLIIAMNLVLGISWYDGQDPTSVDIGVGFSAAWHRYVAVVTGIGIGTIASNVPQPKSGKKAIRRIISAVVSETAGIFCEVSDFSAKKMKHPELVVDAKKDKISGHVTTTVMQLMGARRLCGVVKYEPNLSGPWPAKAYNELLCLCFEVVELTLHLYTFIKRIEDVDVWLPRIVLVAGWRNHHLMAHYFSVVYMVAGALEQGKGLPQITPGHLYLEHARVVSQELAYSLGDEALPQTSDASIFLAAVSVANKLYDRMDRILVQAKAVVGEQYASHEYYMEEMLTASGGYV